MTVVDRPTTPADVLDVVRSMAPRIGERAAEIEAARRVPIDLIDELVEAGCFRMALPASYGGLDATLPETLRVVESLARADASVGWTVFIGGLAWCDLARLPRATFDELYAGPGPRIAAGAFNPTGSITPAKTPDGGYRVTGRWSFASGCQHATWIYGNCIDPAATGMPPLRMAVFAPDQVVIEDTWNVSGLCGTGSHHFHVDDVAVPAERTFVPLAGEPCIDTPIARIDSPPLIALSVAAVAIGVAQGALDDILGLAPGKVPLLAHGPLATNAMFHGELATIDTELRATRTLVSEMTEMLWASGVAGEPLTWEQRARFRATAIWATDRAVDVVDTAYRAGGGSSLYLDCPLQRRFRDIHALTQHFIVRHDTMATAGAILAGQPVDAMVF